MYLKVETKENIYCLESVEFEWREVRGISIEDDHKLITIPVKDIISIIPYQESMISIISLN